MNTSSVSTPIISTPIVATSSVATSSVATTNIPPLVYSPKIILCMIVCNEEKIIRRCIENALPFIDAVSICDTGSTDNTINEIVSVCNEHSLKYCIYENEWKNFGYNRTISFNNCITTATKANFSLNDTYALLLNADMILKCNNSFFSYKDKLTKDYYYIYQTNNLYNYFNICLIKISSLWHCVGVTHEYWTSSNISNLVYDKISNYIITIEDIGDSSYKNNKYERDINLLSQGLIEEPNNTRYFFYLAQTYVDNSQYEEGIYWYKKRVEAGGWPEEVYVSMLRIGVAYTKIPNNESAVYWFLKAYNFRPTRADSLYELTKLYRYNKEYNLSYMFAKEGLKIKYPQNDVLLIPHNVYSFLFEYELTVSCLQLNTFEHLKEGYNYCINLINKHNNYINNIPNRGNHPISLPSVSLPPAVISHTKENLLLYQSKLNIQNPPSITYPTENNTTQPNNDIPHTQN